MTDAALEAPVGSHGGQGWASEASGRRLKKRHAANRRLQFYGLFAIALAIGLLGTLVSSLVIEGYKAFYQSKAKLEIRLDPALIDPTNLADANYRRIFNTAIEQYFPDVKTPAEKRQLADIFSAEARYALRDYVVAHPSQIGQTIKLSISLSDPFDQLEKGVIPRYVEALSDSEKSRFKLLVGRGLIEGRGADAGMKVNLFIDPQRVNTSDLGAANFRDIIGDGLRAVVNSPDFIERTLAILRDDATDILKAYVMAHPESIGRTLKNFKLPLSAPYASLASGETPKIFNQRFVSEKQFEWLDRLKSQGLLTYPFASELLVNSTSRFPEIAGLAGAIVGSFYALMVCFLISFPLGIAAAVYLEEFAPKNRWTHLIEVNINNLAAVPSVVFGLLGLADFSTHSACRAQCHSSAAWCSR